MLNKYNFILIICIIIAVALTVPFGMHPTDHEFIGSLSYRVSLGQLPYIDFDYVRPPLSIFLHSIPFLLTESYGFFLDRLFSIFQIILTSYVSAKILMKSKFISDDLVLAFTAIFIFFSLHNFPAMAWHTIDGILFGVISVYFFQTGFKKKSFFSLMISGIFCAFSFLSKQNFIILLPVFFLLLALSNKKNALIFLIGAMIPVLLFFIYLNITNSMEYFFDNQSENSNLRSLFDALVSVFYIKSPLAIIVVLFFCSFRFIAKYFGVSEEKLLICFIFFIIILSLLEGFIFSNSNKVVSLYQIVMVASICFLFLFAYEKRIYQSHSLFSLLSLISIGLTSTISWGYAYPMLYTAPYLAILLKTYEYRYKKVNYFYVVLLFFLFWAIISTSMYRDDLKINQMNNLGKLYPKLNYIFTGDENYKTYQEIYNLSRGYNVETVIPHHPLFSYVNDQIPNFRVDWFLDEETVYETDKYLNNMKNKLFIVHNKCLQDQINHPNLHRLCLKLIRNGNVINVSDNFSLLRFNGT